jgi:hypothetical protein
MKEDIRRVLLNYVINQKLNEQVMLELDVALKQIIDNWMESKTDKLQEMIKTWEDSIGSEDGSLYSLGLRRAVDIITDTDVFAQLPVLEKPDTPDEA